MNKRNIAVSVVLTLIFSIFSALQPIAASAASVPSAPAAPTVVSGNKSVQVSWSAPMDGGSPITSYTITSSPEAKTCSSSGSALTCSVAGLTNGTAYVFSVIATNAVGSSTASPNSVSVVPVQQMQVGQIYESGESPIENAIYSSKNDFVFFSVSNIVSSNSTLVLDYLSSTQSTERLSLETYEKITDFALNSSDTFLYFSTERRVPSGGIGSSITLSHRILKLEISSFSIVDSTDFSGAYLASPLYPFNSLQLSVDGSTLLALSGQYFSKFKTADLAEPARLITSSEKSTWRAANSKELWDSNFGLQLDPNGIFAYFIQQTNLSNRPIALIRIEISSLTKTSSPSYSTDRFPVGETVLTSGGDLYLAYPNRYGTEPKGSTVLKFSVSQMKLTSVRSIPLNATDVQPFLGGQYLAISNVNTLNNSSSISIFDTASLSIVQNVPLAADFTPSAIVEIPDSRVRIYSADPVTRQFDLYSKDVATPPTISSAVFGNQSASVAWTAPNYSGSSVVSSYKVEALPGGAFCETGELTCEVSGLSNGTTYTFRVFAYNQQGESPPSLNSSEVIPATIPGPPTALQSSILGDKSIRLAWQAPSNNGGSAVTGYKIFAGNLIASCPGVVNYCDIPNLTVGQKYTFSVVAINKAGESSAVTDSTGILPVTMPGKPTSVSANYGIASATVSWTAPTDDGGSAITGYTVSARYASNALLAGPTCTTSGVTTCTVSGLTNGTGYVFTVAATNFVGTGLASILSNSVTPKTKPGVPTSVIGTRGNTQVQISWAAPSSNGGAAITGYTVTSTPESKTCTSNATTSCTISGLTNGTSYSFSVYATNSEGSGFSSVSSAPVIPDVVPGAPTGITAIYGNTTATISWTAPSSNGGTALTGYLVTAKNATTLSNVGKTCSATSETTCTITGLVNGTAYVFTVQAQNAAGYGTSSVASSSIVPRTKPSAPTALSVSRGDTQITVGWMAAASGGATITDYTVTASPGGKTCSTATTSCAVAGLTNGVNYTFTVVATNSEGSGPVSISSSVISPDVAPAAPTNVTAVHGNTTANITWSASVANGGTAQIDYVVTSSPGMKTCTVLVGSTSCVITGLLNGTSYTFTVKGRNAAGFGPASLSSNSITPKTIPGAPSLVTGSRGDSQVTVSWSAAPNGGGAISNYLVSASPGSATCSTTSTSCFVTGLTNGTAYTFSVIATNSEGSGPAAYTSAVTPDVLPNSPSGVSVGYGSASAAISWISPIANGGTPIISYLVTSTVGGKTCTAMAPATSCVVTGLVNGTSYIFNVKAQNAIGYGAVSQNAGPVIPRATPESPSAVTVEALDRSILVEWTPAPLLASSLVTYKAVASPGGAYCTTTNQNSCLVTGLVNGASYTFSVSAIYSNNVASPAVSSVSVIPSTLPDEPTNVSSEGGYLSAMVSWLAPLDNGGLSIISYEVLASPGIKTCVAAFPITSCKITGLTNGTAYSFKVRARNSNGWSEYSLASDELSVGVNPDEPNSIFTIPGSNQVSVFWSEPLSTGGFPVQMYVATSTPGGFVCVTGGATSCVIGGLENGVAYTFSVKAYTSFAGSPNSISSSPVKPVNRSNQPSAISGVFNSATELRVIWTPVVETNITVNSYLVELTESSYPFETMESTTLPSTAISTVFTNLIAGYGYQIRVTALDVNLNELGVASLDAQSTSLPAQYEPSSISGAAAVGSMLVSNFGSWSGSPIPAISRQWYQCTSSSKSSSVLPSGCIAIPRATGPTFVLNSSHAGRKILVGVTATNSSGSVVNFGRTTSTVGSLPRMSVAPKLTLPSVMSVGATVSSTFGTWLGTPNPSKSIRWQTCSVSTRAGSAMSSVCEDIQNAYGLSYTLSAQDIGSYVRPVITVWNTHGEFEYFVSSSGVVKEGVSNVQAPTVGGTMRASTKAIASPGKWTGTPSYKYQWYRCTSAVTSTGSVLAAGCKKILGATKSQVTLTNSDVGKHLLVGVIATNAVGSATHFSISRLAVQ